jgi:glycosyltransferase involved in cell wall biosynthesis
VSSPRKIRCLVVGVRGSGGEEVYSTILRDHPPPGVEASGTFDFHQSCRWGQSRAVTEIALNRLVYPWVPFNMGFRVIKVDPAVDLVHVHTHPTVLLGATRRPVIFSAGSSNYLYLRDYENWSDQRIRRHYRRARWVYKAVGALDNLLNCDLISVSYTFSNWARAAYLGFGVPAAKIHVLYPGFDIPADRSQRQSSDDVTYLFLGRQPHRKGGDLVLSAFRELRASQPRARLIYVSDVLPREPIEGVEARPLVSMFEVSRLYASADVFVNPTRAEGFGFTNAEAQGYGIPVISTRRWAIPEVVRDGVTGLLIEPDDHGALLSAMRVLGESKALRQEMGEAGREHFRARFSLDVFHKGLRSLYDQALSQAGR